MAATLPTAQDVIAIIENLIATRGVKAFKPKGRVQLYSGPQDIIASALSYLSNNQARAFLQSQRLGTKMIDHTAVGKKLGRYRGKKSVYQYFDLAYAKAYGRNSIQAFKQADAVMRFASRAFVKASFGHVATAVCGAGAMRVFFDVELPALVDNSRIETINGIDMDRVRSIYSNKGAYAAFHKICQAEVALAFKHAKTENTKAAWDDYLERKQLFMAERKLALEAKASALEVTAAHISTIHASLEANGPAEPTTRLNVRKVHGKNLH